MLDKNTKKIFEQEVSSENVNGQLTSESFNVYTKLQNPKKRFNIRIFLMYLLIISLLVASAYIFASTIKTAYFNKGSETENSDNNINIIRTSYQNTSDLKVETITPELSELFGIPVGVKIIEIENSNPLFNGLKPNDIIVGISGKPIENINQLDSEVSTIGNEIFLTFNIFRNGTFKDISPFEIDG